MQCKTCPLAQFFTAKNKEGGKHVKLGKRKCTAATRKV